MKRSFFDTRTQPVVGQNVEVIKLQGLGNAFADENAKVRQIGKTGIIINSVHGQGGDAWLVQHDDDATAIGAYWLEELAPLE